MVGIICQNIFQYYTAGSVEKPTYPSFNEGTLSETFKIIFMDMWSPDIRARDVKVTLYMYL